MNEFIKVFSKEEINRFHINNIGIEKLEPMIKRKLVHNLADYILDNLDKIPHNFNRETIASTFEYLESFTMDINIISCEEYARLRNIEDEYYKITGQNSSSFKIPSDLL